MASAEQIHTPSMLQSEPAARVVDTAKVWLKRGIALDGRPAQIRMTKVGGAVAAGVNSAAAPEVSYDRIANDMNAIDPELRGFAWEGVGTTLTVSDIRLQTTSNKRSAERGLVLRANAIAEANPTWRKWIVMGIGLGFARPIAHAVAASDTGPKWSEVRGACLSEWMRGTLEFFLRYIACCNAVDAMLICDGLGMALASGDPDSWLVPAASFSRLIEETSVTGAPEVMSTAERGFDQGVGRASWFVNCGEPDKILSTLSTFAMSPRLPDLWGGVGFAGTYAGGLPEAQWRDLVARATAARGYLAQAAACVASSRLKSSGVFQETEIGCRATWDRSAHDTLIDLKYWFENPGETSVAAAPNGWRHVRFLTEFPDQAR